MPDDEKIVKIRRPMRVLSRSKARCQPSIEKHAVEPKITIVHEGPLDLYDDYPEGVRILHYHCPACQDLVAIRIEAIGASVLIDERTVPKDYFIMLCPEGCGEKLKLRC